MRVPTHFSKVRLFSIVLVIMISLSSIPFFMSGTAGSEIDLEVPTRANGPVVNRSTVEITLIEGFSQIVDNYFNATGYGQDDLFYDPNYDWDEVPYPHNAFEVEYPDGLDLTNTPIKVIVTYDPDNTAFGKVTIDDNGWIDWNSRLYHKEWYVVTITARNKTGSSEAQIRFKVNNINDRPQVISDKDFFSIAFNEDSSYVGINKDHDSPDVIFGDLKDPFDVLTFTCTPVNDLAENVTVELVEDGSYIKFTSEEDWSCPYVPTEHRLKGGNYPDFQDYFCYFMINCWDDSGSFVQERYQRFYVYVGPVNDAPVLAALDVFEVDEDTLANIQFEATDLDEDRDQTITYYTNATTSIYEVTQEQIEFQDEFFWDRETGNLQFMTSNDLVGSYQIEAYVQDTFTEGGRPDYPVTPYKIYQNFTLKVLNVNDAPIARIDQPISTFTYNTSSLIEFNATRTIDVDISHGDILNYTWKRNGNIFGYGALFFQTIDSEGTYNITVNVTDLDGEYSLTWLNIDVEKARIPGEIFWNKDLERDYNDNTTAIVISKTQKEVNLYNGGPNSIDITSVEGSQKGPLYKIQIKFQKELEFLYTEEITQEPKLDLYFLTPEFVESPVILDPQDALDYQFPVPFSDTRYARLEYNLRGPTATYPPSIIALDTIRMLDDRMGVEITLTFVQMDDLGIGSDFQLYAVAEMKTIIKNVDGQTLERLDSWDSSGVNTMPPVITDAQDVDEYVNGDNGIPAIVWIMLVFLLVVIVVIVVVVLILVRRKKKNEPVLEVKHQPEQSVEESIFGDPVEQQPQYPDAQQMYGQTIDQPGEQLPPGQVQEQAGLPPATSVPAQEPGKQLPPAQLQGQTPAGPPPAQPVAAQQPSQ